MEKTNDVVGLGNALIDFLLEIDEERFQLFNLKKGEMHLIDENTAKNILKKIEQNHLQIKTVPGGSTANVLRGLSFLGGKTIFYGKVGFDKNGDTYIQEMKNMGINTKITQYPSTTGYALTFITPDLERTFSTYLGAAVQLSQEDLLEEDISSSKVLFLQGYQFEGLTRETVKKAADLAKKNNTMIALDVSDPGLVRRNKEFLESFIFNYVDLLFLNENEAKELTDLTNEEEALLNLARYVKTVIIKIGRRGSLIRSKGITTRIPAVIVKAVDTTGAGDCYAAGFLYGYCNNLNLQQSGELGSFLAAKIVEQTGVNINALNKEDFNSFLLQQNKSKIKIGIIGGSGLDNPNILHDAQDQDVKTKYGKPSSLLKTGKISGVDVVLLSRHGREHTLPPTQVNYRANIQALKDAGCTHLLATTACGSLRAEIARGDLVFLNQFIDFTRHRTITFHELFTPGQPVHTPMAEPFSTELRQALIHTATELNLKFHPQGTVVTIEGPRFSTKAESHLFRMWNADVINMSIAPEVILANEAGLPYAAIAMSTDYDCWKEDEEPVQWEEILQVFNKNIDKVTNLLINTIPKISKDNVSNDSNKLKLDLLEIKKDEESKVNTKSKTNEENKIDPKIKINEEVLNLSYQQDQFDLKNTIRTIPHWPKQGVMFRDITTLLLNPQAFEKTISQFKEYYQDKNIDKIAGIESRGFIFSAALAREMNLPFVVIRKPGKLPAETVSQEYELEYGTDKIEIHQDAINDGDRILIIDDLIATGGTALAACNLIEKLKGKVAGLGFVIDLPELKGTEKLKNYDVFSLIEFEGK